MEDMARLALVEQNLRNRNNFSVILLELLQLIKTILDNPHDYELRTVNNDVLVKVLDCEAFGDYLKYVGFEKVQNNYVYPKEQSLNKLRLAKAALERKVTFICGSTGARPKQNIKQINNKLQVKKNDLAPINILTTENPFLLQIQSLFNNMLVYEDEELQQLAREQIPMVTLQLLAIDRMREQQRKIKIGEIKGPDMPFDKALLMELLVWFKYKFFSWMDQPDCKLCGGVTNLVTTAMKTVESEYCRVEIFKCGRQECGGRVEFPRFNNPRSLLRSRSGRCGEWANCFTLLCRALGYDTRYVYDVTDHVWCEVWDYDTKSWIHVDPCEAQLDAPLMYSHGWNKQLSYVLAFSRDDLQDVTWRYTTNHKEVLSRRQKVSEQELINAILMLREQRHSQVSPARRKFLTTRNLTELVQLMVERKPSDNESHGRISGSREWRNQRGELGSKTKSHTFLMSKPGTHLIRYYANTDRYFVSCDGDELEQLETWKAGVYRCENVFRKVEKDWRQVYLAREEGEETGSVSWRLSTTSGPLTFDLLTMKMTTAVYETGSIIWKIQFDDEEPTPLQLNDTTAVYTRRFNSATVAAELSGGRGAVSWQHAQLFRQSLDSKACVFEIQARVVSN